MEIHRWKYKKPDENYVKCLYLSHSLSLERERERERERKNSKNLKKTLTLPRKILTFMSKVNIFM